MDPDATKLVFFSIMTTGILVWLWSLTKALRLGATSGQEDRLSFDEDAEFRTQSGEVVVRGEPASLSKTLVRTLRQPSAGMFASMFKVTQPSPKRVVLKKIGPILCNQPPGLYFSEAELHFEPAGPGAVRVSYCLGYARFARLLRKIALGIILGIGLPVMAIVGAIIWFLVVPNDEPRVRWQVFQTLQIGHALWPPFLFMGFYKAGWRHSKTFVENLIESVDASDFGSAGQA